MAEHRRTKRSRTDDSDAETPVATRGDPWLDDGNVILQAGSTQFRVHRSVLSASSPIFKDMFVVCDPSDDAMVDGCPVVHLSDTANELHHVVKAIYDRSYHFSDRDLLPISVIAAFLRLGDKYGIDQLRSEAVSRLTSVFPTTLEESDRNWERRSSIITDIQYTRSLFIAVNLGRECSLPSVLPAAMLICSNVQAKDILRGVLLNDGTRCIMSPADQEACITGRLILLERQGTKTLKWLDPKESYAGCHQPQACDRERQRVFQAIWYPLPKFMPLARWDDKKLSFCKFCSKKSSELHNAGRQGIWDELPSIYGLPEWEELRKQQ